MRCIVRLHRRLQACLVIDFHCAVTWAHHTMKTCWPLLPYHTPVHCKLCAVFAAAATGRAPVRGRFRRQMLFARASQQLSRLPSRGTCVTMLAPWKMTLHARALPLPCRNRCVSLGTQAATVLQPWLRRCELRCQVANRLSPELLLVPHTLLLPSDPRAQGSTATRTMPDSGHACIMHDCVPLRVLLYSTYPC